MKRSLLDLTTKGQGWVTGLKEVTMGQWGQLKVNQSPLKLWVNNKKEQLTDMQKTMVILKSVIMSERSRHKKRT